MYIIILVREMLKRKLVMVINKWLIDERNKEFRA
jgi:hypothetical protein